MATHAQQHLPIPLLVKRNTLLITAIQAAAGAGLQLIPTLGALMVVRLLGSATWIGVASSVLGISRAVVAYPVGSVTDRYGRKPGLVLGLCFSVIGALMLGTSMVASSFPLFLVGILVFGLGVGAVHQLRVAAADMYPPARRAEGLGYLLTGSLVGAIGGTVMVSLAQLIGDAFALDALSVAWFIVPLLLLPAFLLVYFVRPDPIVIAARLQDYYPGYQPPPQRAEAGPPPATGIRTFIRHYPKRTAFMSSLAAQGSMVMIMTMTALVLHYHGQTLPAISLAVSVHVVGMFALSLPLGKAADRWGRKPVMLAGLVIGGFGSLLIVATPVYWVIAMGGFLVGAGWSCVNVSATALLADTTTPGERGRAIGASDTFSGVANILMPLAVGPLTDLWGITSVGVFGALVMVPPIVMLLRLYEGRPGQFEPELARELELAGVA